MKSPRWMTLWTPRNQKMTKGHQWISHSCLGLRRDCKGNQKMTKGHRRIAHSWLGLRRRWLSRASATKKPFSRALGLSPRHPLGGARPPTCVLYLLEPSSDRGSPQEPDGSVQIGVGIEALCMRPAPRAGAGHLPSPLPFPPPPPPCAHPGREIVETQREVECV